MLKLTALLAFIEKRLQAGEAILRIILHLKCFCEGNRRVDLLDDIDILIDGLVTEIYVVIVQAEDKIDIDFVFRDADKAQEHAQELRDLCPVNEEWCVYVRETLI